MKRIQAARRLAAAMLAVAASAGTSVAEVCPLGSQTTDPCSIFGFLNVPIDARLSQDEQRHLVVCNAGALEDEFGVEWFLVVDGHTGHTDWIDLGKVAWEPLDAPGTTSNAEVRVVSTAVFTGGTERNVTSLLQDIGTQVEISTNLTQVGATSVIYEVYATETSTTPIDTEEVNDSAAQPMRASDWPVRAEFSRFTFASNVTFTFPSGDTASGRVLGLHAEGDDPSSLVNVRKVRTTAKGVKQTLVSSHGPQGTPDLCTSDNQLTLTDEGLGSMPLAIEAAQVPAISRVGLAALVLLVAGIALLALGARSRA